MHNRQFLRRIGGIGHSVVAGHKIVIIPVAALAAANPKMRTAQRFGHAAGRDPIDLHDKNNKDQRSGKRRDQPFDIMIQTVDFRVAAAELVFFRRRKQMGILKNSIKL